MPETTPKVFVSSTVEDLRPYREAAKEAVVEAGMVPVMQEYFPAADNPPYRECMEKVAGTDLLVVIVAHRYGWVPEDQPGDERKSITRLECEKAIENDREVLAFVVDEKAQWPEGGREEDRISDAVRNGKSSPELLEEVERNVRQLADFKSWLNNRAMRSTFTDAKDLRHAVYAALQDWRQRHGTVEAPPEESAKPAQHKITPRGLRSFEPQDHEWFLRLLPGGGDERRLPLSIRFWKERLERTDTNRPLRVGLIYGPSGCGKSSLVKAGLIRALANFVLPIYVEASGDRTEADLLAKLRAEVSGLPEGLSLSQSLKHFRNHPDLLAGRRVAMILDQFEQWLRVHQSGEEAELVAALRECDGVSVQAVLMVRDEFVTAVHRFFQSLDVPIQEHVNMQIVDLFDRQHAAKVLAEYGRAYDRLLDDVDALTKEKQREFLDGVIKYLQTPDERVVCVQIALAAQMLKDREWTSKTLNEIDGATGIGLEFLKRNFDARTANPEHRAHRAAAVKVLEELLPPSGTDIKGSARSIDDLRAASGYADSPRDFEALMRLLDEDLKIVTGTDTGLAEDSAATGGELGPATGYQLTHDYLVAPLRRWLTDLRTQTRRGRAMLRLERRAKRWRDTKENRDLPTLTRYLQILAYVPKRGLNAEQSALLRAANRFYSCCGLLAGALILLLGLSGWLVWEDNRDQHAMRALHAVVNVRPEGLTNAVEDLRVYRQRALEPLSLVVDQGRFFKEDEPEMGRRQRLQAVLALAYFGDVRQDALLELLAEATPPECTQVVAFLRANSEGLSDKIRKRFQSETNATHRARLATLAFHLGETGYAKGLLELKKNPVERTTFVHSYASWHGELNSVARELRNAAVTPEDAHFRSGLCSSLSLMGFNSLSQTDQSNLTAVLTELYIKSPDSGTHSAALCALKRWGRPIPRDAPSLRGSNRAPPQLDWHINTVGITMVKIPEGEFEMGDDKSPELDERPRHPVRLTGAFWMSDREVTVKEFRRFLGDTDYRGGKPEGWESKFSDYKRYSPKPDCPVHSVSWGDAVMFCNWLTWKEWKGERKPAYRRMASGEWQRDPETQGYRLPTEAEWEYACRAGTQATYCFGDDSTLLAEYSWYGADSSVRTWPSGKKLPNSWGLFDVHGNLWERCEDWYGASYYRHAPRQDPPGPEEGEGRVLRGGAFDSAAGIVRCSFRDWRRAEFFVGFRVVASPFRIDL